MTEALEDLQREATELNSDLQYDKDTLINGRPSPERRDEIWSGVEEKMARLKEIEAQINARR